MDGDNGARETQVYGRQPIVIRRRHLHEIRDLNRTTGGTARRESDALGLGCIPGFPRGAVAAAAAAVATLNSSPRNLSLRRGERLDEWPAERAEVEDKQQVSCCSSNAVLVRPIRSDRCFPQ